VEGAVIWKVNDIRSKILITFFANHFEAKISLFGAVLRQALVSLWPPIQWLLDEEGLSPTLKRPAHQADSTPSGAKVENVWSQPLVSHTSSWRCDNLKERKNINNVCDKVRIKI
jgi:hypothetical protein